MDELLQMLPSLSAQQISALTHVATAMLYSEPKGAEDYLTVRQIASEYRRSQRSIYNAMDAGTLPYTTPHGQTKPRYIKRSDFEEWMGMR